MPKYFSFKELLEEIAKEVNGKKLSDYYGSTIDSAGKQKLSRPCYYENVNHRFLNNKDGKFAWRPFQIIHPAIYVSLVNEITSENNWREIVAAFKRFSFNNQIKCLSIPIESENLLSDKAENISNWWHSVEQNSIELSLKYEYIMHTDISDCYGSIYTHSIVWALHTKKIAKEQRRDRSLIGNIIDSHIQDMSFAQTNGIPQGSGLMDLIAEIVLGFADLELSEKLESYPHLIDYQILRYRDDYRVFTNNPQESDLIVKSLTEILGNLGLKLNSQKTLSSNTVVTHSIKPDKLYWITNQIKMEKLQDSLLFIHDLSCKYPNSGSLCRALDSFFDKISKVNKERDDIIVMISILVDIMLKNPRTYPIGAGILSKLISLIKPIDKQVEILKTIIYRFQKLPNIGYLEIWIQRIALKIDKEITFGELLCKKLNNKNSNISLWNSDWIANNKLKKIINDQLIVNEKTVENMSKVVKGNEVKLFYSKNNYYF
ncbi:Reverse transcriptase (RNA-dependent DNA polymerase) [Synechococcus sp. PCC 7502]|uniref:RNA-directed DNA polymerase n=1 Tax=Synechococcus sp. PCC 7502 TaxID=1173263 RepID=UPI00029FBED4|nr:RNA-directed DNA polymerase [Synechococcus sp. PCC 7502]AFY74933.1 Reverse transcriptase (RNA-dependent DNA polymerase) [Synechococcus sp. PCC 7502]